MKPSRSLANFFAMSSHRSELLAESEQRLKAGGPYPRVWRPHPRWLVATTPVQGSADDGVAGGPLIFAEGRDLFAGSAADGLLAELAGGAPRLARFPGDFTFLWVGGDGQAIAVRACAGLTPVYLWQGADRVAIATQCDALIRCAGWRGSLEPLTAAIWSTAFPSNLQNRSHLAGVKTLAAGELATLDTRSTSPRCEIRRYWNPLPAQLRRGAAPDVAGRQRRLRELLLARLAGDLDPGGRNLLSLSGGVDSASLLALSKTLGVPVMTWSQVPPEGSTTRAREFGYLEPLRQWAGVKRFWQTDMSAQSEEQLILDAPALPFPVLHQALCVLPSLLREAEIKVLVGGEFGDEICGARVTTPDWAMGTTLPDLLAHPRQWPLGLSAPARWLKVRLLDALGHPYRIHPDRLRGFCPPLLQSAYRDALADLQRWARALPALYRYLFTRHVTLDFAAMNWEACSALGLRRSIPFLTRETIELTLSCHPSELIGPGMKQLLRGALHGDVPQQNLQRPDKGDFGLDFLDAPRPIAELRLDDEEFWGELTDIVAPAWRQAAIRAGTVTHRDKYSLLYLMQLQRNLKAALRSASAAAPAPP